MLCGAGLQPTGEPWKPWTPWSPCTEPSTLHLAPQPPVATHPQPNQDLPFGGTQAHRLPWSAAGTGSCSNNTPLLHKGFPVPFSFRTGLAQLPPSALLLCRLRLLRLLLGAAAAADASSRVHEDEGVLQQLPDSGPGFGVPCECSGQEGHCIW